MANFRPSYRVTSAICIGVLAVSAPLKASVARGGNGESPITCPVQAATTRGCTDLPTGGRYPQQNSDGDIIGIAVGLIGAFLTAVAINSLTGGGEMSVKKLDKEGPKPPERELLGKYQVQGVLYRPWPVVVEVNAEPGTTTFLNIVPHDVEKKKLPVFVISDAGGIPWKNRTVVRPAESYQTERGILARFEIPDDLKVGGKKTGDGFSSARFTVLSGKIEGKDFIPTPLQVFALGAGPNAVGSAAVTITQFVPAPTSRRAAYAVTFNERRQFDSLRGELIKRKADGDNLVRETVGQQDLCADRSGTDLCVTGPPRHPYQTLGQWSAKDGGELKRGQTYHMDIRAWTRRAPTGGWIISQAPKAITWP